MQSVIGMLTHGSASAPFLLGLLAAPVLFALVSLATAAFLKHAAYVDGQSPDILPGE